jgi:hypothetical protein
MGKIASQSANQGPNPDTGGDQVGTEPTRYMHISATELIDWTGLNDVQPCLRLLWYKFNIELGLGTWIFYAQNNSTARAWGFELLQSRSYKSQSVVFFSLQNLRRINTLTVFPSFFLRSAPWLEGVTLWGESTAHHVA